MMYRTILINTKQRNLQRIVWCESEHESPKIYELSTVTYGTVSAPYLAQRTLTQLSMDEEANFPIAASVLRNNLYMDDVLCGAATLEEAIVLRQQLKEILKSAGMELHKLCANHEKLSPDPEQNYNFATLKETKTLGVSWKPNLDCFLIKVKVCLDSSYTKRDVLSTIAKIFDPVGLMAPVISKAKIFLQQVIEIHGFADASERCYGAAVYCKSKNLKSETLVWLITSKSRVAPIKSLTIPRLELCAAVLLAKLVKRVVAVLQLETAELYLWSDSMIVLAWLRKEPMDLKTFVQNRVAKIQELYPNQLWRHVPSDQNPADLVSRRVDPDKLLQQNLWFNGPTFLSGDDDYPNRTISCREKLDEYNSELKNCVNEQVQVLIGVDGHLYFRVCDLLQLLQIKSVSKHSHVFPCKHVLPSHKPYPKALQNTRVVDIKGLFSILHAEHFVMRDLFFKALTMGYAHQTGMRKITDKFKNGPTLTLVGTPNDKSVFIPEWIHRFKLDVKKVRREEIKCQKPIHVIAPIATDYPSECIFDSIESNPHNVSQPVIEIVIPMEDC
ncbi:uncharacterized protein TNCV_533161 [Trichonephila clavipes]|nr:uncharacterized protein TNCV_533161 [Trichonephila clavipes]